MLFYILLYISIIMLTGLLSVRIGKNPFAGRYFAPAVCMIMSLVLLVIILTGYESFQKEIFSSGRISPFFEFTAGADSLSLFFMIPLMILTASCSIYGSRYFKKVISPLHWFSYAMLVSGMVLVLVSWNAVLFLVSWELMSLSSFILVVSDYEKEEVRRAGLIYFITAHIGIVFLFTAFFLLSESAGSFDFEVFNNTVFTVSRSNLIFICALIGFGFKAGFIPFHIWLPLAHPAAPSHVSALMSGIMIKMGIYGILRVLLFLNQFQPWWGILLVFCGSLTGILAVLFAIGQHDIKRLLAYSSVENIGIILLGLGIGITGRAYNYNTVSALGFAGALLHIVNHAFFKGLLFLGAGAIIRQTGTGEIDRLGGLIKKLPWTGTLFLTGSAAIAGLPFFNGFISELMIYISSVTGAVKSGGSIMPLISAITVISLAVIGGLASICFTKIFGTVFQGHSRKTDISNITEVPFLMKSGMLFLTSFIVFIGMASYLVIPFLENPVSLFAGDTAGVCLIKLENIFIRLSIILFSILFLIIVLLGIKSGIYKKRAVKVNETWGCGYSFPADTMQYTASSYADPLIDKSRYMLSGKKEKKFDSEYFPGPDWSFKSEVNDWFLSRIFEGSGKMIDRIFSLLRWFQCGKAGVYVIYIAFAVIIMIVWKFVL